VLPTDYMGILHMKAKGFSVRSISSSLQTNKRTVLDCINRAESAGITFSFVEGSRTKAFSKCFIARAQGVMNDMRYRTAHLRF